MEKRQFNGFSFTNMIDSNINKDITDEDIFISNLLNKSTQINKYSNIIRNYLFIYIAIDPDKPFLSDKKIMRHKTKRLDLYMNVNYKEFIRATKEEARKIIAELYLTGIKKYLSKQKDFNHELFYTDVKELFEKEGII